MWCGQLAETKRVFDKYDRDGSGMINAQELYMCVRRDDAWGPCLAEDDVVMRLGAGAS